MPPLTSVHLALDIDTADDLDGAPVFAIGDGTVVGVAPIWGDEWADAVIIEHDSDGYPATFPGTPDASGICQLSETPMVDPVAWLGENQAKTSSMGGSINSSTTLAQTQTAESARGAEPAGTRLQLQVAFPAGVHGRLCPRWNRQCRAGQEALRP